MLLHQGVIVPVLRVEIGRRHAAGLPQGQGRNGQQHRLADQRRTLPPLQGQAQPVQQQAHRHHEEGHNVVNIPLVQHRGQDGHHRQGHKGRQDHHQAVQTKGLFPGGGFHLFEQQHQGQQGGHGHKDGRLQPVAHFTEVIQQPLGVLGEVGQVLHGVAAGDQLVRRQLMDAVREGQQQAQGPAQSPGNEVQQLFIFLLPQHIEHIGAAEEEGVEHEVVLGHHPRQNGQPHQRAQPGIKVPQQPGDQPGQQQRQHGQQHIHPDHQHGGQAQQAQPIEDDGGAGDVPAAEQGLYQPVKAQQRQHIDHIVQRQARPFTESVGEQAGHRVEKPVVQGRVHVHGLVVVHRAEVEALSLCDGHIVEKLLAGDHLAQGAAALDIRNIGGIAAVGQTVGVDFIDEHAALAAAEQQANRRHRQKHQRHCPVFFNRVFHGTLQKRIDNILYAKTRREATVFRPK